MVRFVIAYVAAAVLFCLLDFLWLGFVAKGYYQSQVGSLEKPRLPAAAAFYALYIVGVIIFAVSPALDADSWSKALVNGALFGFFAYATYDLSNLATLKGWSTGISLVDMTWGSLVSGASATAGYLAAQLVR